jgi:lysophospholipase L1-like esterase
MGKYKTFGSRFDRVHRNDLNANFAAVETDINAQKNRVDNLIAGTPQPSEVVDSRGGFPVLRDRLDNLSSDLAQKAAQTDLNTTNSNVALKADKSYVDDKFSFIGNASPKGAYATLVNLQTAFPSGNTNIYVVSADGKWYYWNGSAWTAGGTYQSTGIADGSISPAKTNFYVGTSNLFNSESSDIKNGMSLDTTTGNEIVDAARFITGFIDISAYVDQKVTVYYYNASNVLQNTRTFYYDASHVFISSLVGTNTIPVNAKYARFYGTPSLINTYMLLLGSDIPTKYIPYAYLDAKKVISNGKSIIDITDNLTNKLNAPITPAKTDFYVTTSNLFDKDSSENVLGKNLSTDGTEIVDAARFVSHWINVSSYVSQTVGAFYFNDSGVLQGTTIYFYDVNKSFLRTNAIDTNVPSNGYYARFAPSLTNLNKMMFWVGGANPTVYVPFSYLDGNKVFINGRSLDSALTNVKTTFESKKWTSYGDSITELNSWQPYVVNNLGMVHTNRGVGSTRVSGESFVTEGGVTKYSMCSDTRIATIPIDTEIITVMGGSNDWSVGAAIGTMSSPMDNTTFYGAYRLMLDKIYVRVPNARVVILIPPYRDSESTTPINGYYLEDYRKAIREIAYYYGYQTIDLKAACGINQANKSTFLMDVVHPNDAGGKRIAEVVIGALKAVEPIS